MINRLRDWLNTFSPAQFLAISFLGLIGLGTILLMIPAASVKGVSLVDALFTATSAVCVTGHIVVEPSTTFTFFGQLVIICLIQIGGLGIMATSTFVLLALGRRASLRNLQIIREEYTVTKTGATRSLVLIILGFTLLAEGVGALILLERFHEAGLTGGKAVWYAIFHSVSAFCNAGFSLFPDSFISFKSDIGVNLVVPILIIMGGLGFPAIIDVFHNIKARVKKERMALSIHAKIVVSATAALIVGGMILFYLFEATRESGTFGDKLMMSWFQSVTTRTAGFQTIDFGFVSDATILLTMILMFIGAAPGSTAGGIKITTLVVILMVVIGRLRGVTRVEIGGRTIPDVVITKALVVAVLSIGLVIGATMLLLYTDGDNVEKMLAAKKIEYEANNPGKVPPRTDSFSALLFHVVSAFGTVGLGVLDVATTGALTVIGKLVIIVVMYLGRLGPLIFAEMVLASEKPQKYKYPEEYLLVG